MRTDTQHNGGSSYVWEELDDTEQDEQCYMDDKVYSGLLEDD